MQQECSIDIMGPPHFYKARPCHLSLNYPQPLRPHRLKWGEDIQGSEKGSLSTLSMKVFLLWEDRGHPESCLPWSVYSNQMSHLHKSQGWTRIRAHGTVTGQLKQREDVHVDQLVRSGQLWKRITFTIPSSSLPQTQLCVPKCVEPQGQPDVCGGSAGVHCAATEDGHRLETRGRTQPTQHRRGAAGVGGLAVAPRRACTPNTRCLCSWMNSHLHARDVSHQMKWFPPAHFFFGWGGFKRGILKYPVRFPKVFIKTAHKVSLESLGGL